jgi:hypothetical protein
MSYHCKIDISTDKPIESIHRHCDSPEDAARAALREAWQFGPGWLRLHDQHIEVQVYDESEQLDHAVTLRVNIELELFHIAIM